MNRADWHGMRRRPQAIRAQYLQVRSPSMAPPFLPSPPLAGGEGRVRGPSNMKKWGRCRTVTSSRILWQAPPSPYPLPPQTGGEGEKVGPARGPSDRENLAEGVGGHGGMLAVLHAGDGAARRRAMKAGRAGEAV